MMRTLAALAMVPALTSLAGAAELVTNGGFDDATGWWATQNLEIEIVDRQLCVDVPGGTTNPWDAIVGTNDLPLVKGETYDFSFAYRGDPAGPVRALVQMPVDPYTSYVEATPRAGTEGKTATRTFKSPVDRPDGQIVFQVGGSRTDWTFCLDNVSLVSGGAVAAYTSDTGPRIRVNQVGYLPNGPKHATLVSNSATALPFKLVDATGTTLFEGTTAPRGLDPSAGVKVHTLDFTATTAVGDGLTISVDGQTSYPFDIRADLYVTLVVDAMSYFYPVRSGIAIDRRRHRRRWLRPPCGPHRRRAQQGGHIGRLPAGRCERAHLWRALDLRLHTRRLGRLVRCRRPRQVCRQWRHLGRPADGRLPPRLALGRAGPHPRRQAAHSRAWQPHP
jgi:endoglucanase